MSALFFQNGMSIGANAGWCGYTGNNNYVVRYSFSTGPQGAGAVSIALSGIYYGSGASSQGFGFRISTSSVAYANARNLPPDSNYGVMSYSSATGYGCTLIAEGLNLSPNTSYYLFVYLATSGMEYYSGWNCVDPAIVCSGAYTPPTGAISSVSSQVNTLSPVSLILSGSPYNWHKASFSHGGTLLGVSEVFTASLSHVCPRDWMRSDTGAQAIEVDVSIQGYSDSACLNPAGQPLTCSFVLKADPAMRPILPAEAVTALALNEGAASGFTRFISGISRARISFDREKINLDNCAGATVAGYVLSYKDSRIQSGEPTADTAILTSDAAINCVVIDSRGREGSVTLSIKPEAYVPPSLSSIEVRRCDYSGNDSENGHYYKIKADSQYTPLEGENEISLGVKVQPVGGSWGSETALPSFQSGLWSSEWTPMPRLGATDPEKSYKIAITVKDTVGCSSSYTVGLYHRSWAMKFNSKGTAVGFGMEPAVDRAVQMPDIWRFYPGIIVLSDSSCGYTEPEKAVADPVEGQLYFLLSY